MENNTDKKEYSLQVSLTYFIAMAPIVNLLVLFTVHQPILLALSQIFVFLYVIVTPGLFLLPLFIKKKLPFALGVAFSVALSLFVLMFSGLLVNTFLPFAGISHPLSTIPLLLTFDIVLAIIFTVNVHFELDLPLTIPSFNRPSLIVVVSSVVLPILAVLGALSLNNGGSNVLTMITLGLVPLFILFVLIKKQLLHESVAPIVLYMIALALLLMNSMRGWFVTGHDILLEYHVFDITNQAHQWSMSFFKDPYNACLSLTILPTYLQNLIHLTGDAYIFKFFTQFIGALPVIVVYNLSREYVSEEISLLSSFLYIAFPTFMIDMAFLNRQGIAFLFFGTMVVTLFATEYFAEKTKMSLLLILGTGMVFSHYSTSYVAVPLLVTAYILDKVIRLVMRLKKPEWLYRLTHKVGNIEIYQKPSVIKPVFVLGLLVIMFIWSTLITKTSTNVVNTIHQIGTSLAKPFSLDQQSNQAKYSLISSETPPAPVLFNKFVQQGEKQQKIDERPKQFYPASLTASYKANPIAEEMAPLNKVGTFLKQTLHLNLTNIFNAIKQLYAKFLQVLLLIGLIGLVIGYSFKKNILKNVPVEYIALSLSGIIILVGQTVLPASAIDYGLLRLFQQNLLFLCLPIFLGLFLVVSLFVRTPKKQLITCAIILVFFFLTLSGFFPQVTGGGRPQLALNNSGLYYDSYYTHAEDVASGHWLSQNLDSQYTIQAAHFSDIRLLPYGRISTNIGLIPQTTRRDSYVFLNYYNVKHGNILETVDGYIIYYTYPIDFLNENKDLIYNNGGSEIYR